MEKFENVLAKLPKTQSLVVLMSGYKRHGKDTSAKILIDSFGFERLAFADPLKSEVLQAYPDQDWDIFSDEKKEVYLDELALEFCRDPEFVALALAAIPAIRKAELAKLKSTAVETLTVEEKEQLEYLEHNPTLRIDSALKSREIAQVWGTEYRRKDYPDYWVDRIREKIKPGKRYVVTDCRFPNELKLRSEYLGFAVRVFNPRKGKPADGHASEHALDGAAFDLEILNEGSIEDLHQKLISELSELVSSSQVTA